MKKKSKSRIKKLMASALLVCTLACSIDTVSVNSVTAKEDSLKEENTIIVSPENEIEESSDQIVLNTKVGEIEFTLTAPYDAFLYKEDLSLEVEEITDDRLEQAKDTIEEKIFQGNQEIKSYRLFDVTPMYKGEEIQPEKPVKVSFKNLTLTDKEGITTDVREKIEEENNPDKSEAYELDTDEDKEIKMYHFSDENTAEEINTTADNKEVITELDHFSWILAADVGMSGEEYDVLKGQNYKDEANDNNPYALDYILRHYNVFVSGDYLGTHVVGPMVVGGQTMLHGSLGGVTQDTGDYVHTAPSYLEGYAYNEDNPDAFPEIITCNTEMPVYVGQSNKDMTKHKVTHNPHYWTKFDPWHAKGPVDSKTMYVNFEEAFPTNVPEIGQDGKPVPIPEGGKGNLPEYSVDSTVLPVEKYPWNENDAEHYISAETPDIVPNGLIYGPEDGSEKGTINYYRHFNGYDINGIRVLPVSIPSSLFDDILNETNDGKGKDSKGEELDGSDEAKSEDRRMGYVRYYNVDEKTGRAVAVTELNEMNNGRGAKPSDFDDPELHLDKNLYAFAIDTKNTQFRKDENGVNIATVMNTIDVSVRLRPGFNFTFDKFETGWSNDTKGIKPGSDSTELVPVNVKGKVQNVVYDYISDKEMSNKLMIINTNEHTEQLVIPRIYKSIENDSFGSNYQFNSIEKGPGFSALWIAPYVREVYVGFTDPWARKNATNGSKLVGHLVVPQADVWLGGGDFNGGIIARNVDASTVGSEGHMWPFVIGSSINGVRIEGEKRVDGTAPAVGEQFFFKYILEKKEADGSYREVKRDVFGHGIGGKFQLNLDDKVFTAEDGKGLPGDYRITVSELANNEEFTEYAYTAPEAIGYDQVKFQELVASGKYTFDPKVFQGTFTVKLQEIDTPTDIHEKKPRITVDPSSGNITWMVDASGKGNFTPYNQVSIVYNNTSQRGLKVIKEWKDQKGNIISNDKESVSFDLYRDSTRPTGNRINVNIYSTDNINDVARKRLVKTEMVGYVDDGKSVSFNLELDPDEELEVFDWGASASAGVESVTINDGLSFDDPKKAVVTCDFSKYEKSSDRTDMTNGNPNLPRGVDITLSNVNENIIVNVLYISSPLTIARRQKNGEYEYAYSGGYSSQGMVDAEYVESWDKEPITVQVEKRTVFPEKDVFNLKYFDVDADAWNVPLFKDENGNELKPYMTAQQIEKSGGWEKVYTNLAPRDENGNPYYYKVVENPIPEGYSASYTNNITRITNSTKENPITIKITNTIKDGVSFAIDKVNDSGIVITENEAKFQMFKVENGNVSKEPMCFIKNNKGYEYVTSRHVHGAVDTIVTEKGKWKIGFIPYGDYVLKEIEAPDGYDIENRPMYISFSKIKEQSYYQFEETNGQFGEKVIISPSNDTEVIREFSMDFVNKAQGGPELPDTGGPGLRRFIIIGITSLSLCLMIAYLELKRRRKEDCSR